MGCGPSIAKDKTKDPGVANPRKNNPDESLYSRQMAVYGAETQSKLMKMKVFIYGLQGIGIETAKNIVLAGPQSITIQDDDMCTIQDTSVNFYITQQHVQSKATRAEACSESLQELNPYCIVNVQRGEITNEILSQYNVVVFTDYYDQAKLIEFNKHCRNNSIGFIYTGSLGLYGFAFVDFGPQHKVYDSNGEEPKNTIIVSITQEAEGLVTTHEEKRHGLMDGDYVTFKEVQGMTEVNGEVFKVKVKSPFTFTLDKDTTKFNMYTRQGIVVQVKMPEDVAFKSLEESLLNPVAPNKDSLDMCDFEKFGRPEQLHLILLGIMEFAHQNQNRLPYLLNEDDAAKLVKIVENLKQSSEAAKSLKIEGVPEDLIRNVSLYARASISPIASFWGGVVAQEIVKFTGKFTPLRQWLHHEVFECIPDKKDNSSINVQELQNSQNASIVALFGKDFAANLAKLKIFLVGAGALGCEFLKMFALMGVGTNPQNGGGVHITDDDNIETSNLNRQFLFRKQNVGKPKSEVAAKAANAMNPNMKVQSYKLRVAPENESYFNDTFWESLSFVVNAVDNVKARLFVDGQCVWFEKPLFESGTLGTKCNSQVILPKATQSYGDSVDPPEESIPLCTLKNFPYQIEHTIQWARDYFEGFMVEGPSELSQFVKNPESYILKLQRENDGKPGILRFKLETLQKLAQVYIGGTHTHFALLAREIFQEIFTNQIAQLLHSFPLDHKTEEGLPFWSGQKRPPQVVYFDEKDEIHVDFIQSSVNILSTAFGMKHCLNREEIKKMVKGAKVKEFKPAANVKINVNNNDQNAAASASEDDEEFNKRIANELLALKIPQGKNISPQEFEKDDPKNFHIDLMASIANLRARNYKIGEADKFKVKLIAGKIIPALATTTAMIVGAVGIEIIKHVLQKPTSTMKNSFMNLALPMWLFSEPLPPVQNKDKDYDEIMLGPVKAIPSGYTNWDKISVNGPMTIEGLLEHFEKQYKVKLSIVSVGKTCIYNAYDSSSAESKKKDIIGVYEQMSKTKVSEHQKFVALTVSGETIDDGIDCNMPIVKYRFK